MSNSSKAVGVIIAILALGGIIWAVSSSSPAAVQNPTSQTASADGTQATTTAPAAVSDAPVDSSDASINSDLSAVDTQTAGLNADSANAAKASAQQ